MDAVALIHHVINEPESLYQYEGTFIMYQGTYDWPVTPDMDTRALAAQTTAQARYILKALDTRTIPRNALKGAVPAEKHTTKLTGFSFWHPGDFGTNKEENRIDATFTAYTDKYRPNWTEATTVAATDEISGASYFFRMYKTHAPDSEEGPLAIMCLMTLPFLGLYNKLLQLEQ